MENVLQQEYQLADALIEELAEDEDNQNLIPAPLSCQLQERHIWMILLKLVTYFSIPFVVIHPTDEITLHQKITLFYSVAFSIDFIIISQIIFNWHISDGRIVRKGQDWKYLGWSILPLGVCYAGVVLIEKGMFKSVIPDREIVKMLGFCLSSQALFGSLYLAFQGFPSLKEAVAWFNYTFMRKEADIQADDKYAEYTKKAIFHLWKHMKKDPIGYFSPRMDSGPWSYFIKHYLRRIRRVDKSCYNPLVEAYLQLYGLTPWRGQLSGTHVLCGICDQLIRKKELVIFNICEQETQVYHGECLLTSNYTIFASSWLYNLSISVYPDPPYVSPNFGIHEDHEYSNEKRLILSRDYSPHKYDLPPFKSPLLLRKQH